MSRAEQLEAVLFAADAPVNPESLAELLGATPDDVKDELEQLGGRLASAGALQLVRIAGGYQICTKPEHADLIATFLRPQRRKLSRTLLEVLAIVAYRQPVTLGEIEAVRGVQSDYGLRQLLERRLIREAGRRPTPGRPMVYTTTQQFLHWFNLNDLSELPPLTTEAPIFVPESEETAP